MKLGIDAGNYKVKVAGECGIIDFISALGESRELNLVQFHGSDDMYFEHEGETGFAGTLALYESEFGGSLMGNTKAHRDTKLRVLIGIHRYCQTYNISESVFEVVLGQPILNHNQEEKQKIKNMIRGQHTISVNGIKRTFFIEKVEVAAEGVSSFWSNQREGLVRIIDIGSGTVNYSTVYNGKFIDKDSGTLLFGANTNKSNSLQSLTRGMATHLFKKWNQKDTVLIVGGISETILPHVKEYFSNAEVLYPIFKQQYVSSIFANAIAFHIIAVSVYE